MNRETFFHSIWYRCLLGTDRRMCYRSLVCVQAKQACHTCQWPKPLDPAFISGPLYMNNPGINLLEYCSCLANSPKFMLQHLTELLLIPFLKGKRLATFITPPVEKSITH